MSRTLRLAVFSGAIVVVAIGAGLVFTTRGSAQQLPPPNEPPEECCHLMTPGGRTIGGPAIETQQPFGGEGPVQTQLLNSEDPINICVTLTNLNDPLTDSGHMLLFVESTFPLVPIPGRPPDAVVVHPGRTRVKCGTDDSVGISCLTSSTHCRYRWRIDLAPGPATVQVGRPR